MKAYTDYPIIELNNSNDKQDLTKEVEILSYDGNKYCLIKINSLIKEIKPGYLYKDTKINRLIKEIKAGYLYKDIKLTKNISDFKLKQLPNYSDYWLNNTYPNASNFNVKKNALPDFILQYILDKDRK
jgi:hypothetical protein